MVSCKNNSSFTSTLNKLLNNNNNLIALTSDLGFGHFDNDGSINFSRNSLVQFFQGKFCNDDKMLSLVKRLNKLIIAGNLITCPENVDRIIKNSYKFNDSNNKAYKAISESYDDADEYLKYLSSTIQVDLMPGSDDMSDDSYPKKPIISFFLPKSSRENKIQFVTCPYKFKLGKAEFLGTSGK